MFSRISLTALGKGVLRDLETPTKGPIIQLVRWRKRRWAPKNASKIYYVRKPTPEDPVEKEELLQRYRHYKTTMKSLAAYFKEELDMKEAGMSSKVQTDKEEAEWAGLLKINEAWNKATGEIREARQAAEERSHEEQRLKDLAAIEEEKLATLLKSQKLVQEEIVQSKDFIHHDNLEAEIEKALNQRVSYNWAIDRDGNRYIELADRSTVAETKEAETVRRFEEPQEKRIES